MLGDIYLYVCYYCTHLLSLVYIGPSGPPCVVLIHLPNVIGFMGKIRIFMVSERIGK